MAKSTLEFHGSVGQVKGGLQRFQGHFDLQTGLNLIRTPSVQYTLSMSKKALPVNKSGVRIRLFLSGQTKCICCGVQGERWYIEKQLTDNAFSFHLYAKADGKWVRLTHDHILPKSRGGTDSFANAQTMCQPCNNKKKNQLDLQGLRKALHNLRQDKINIRTLVCKESNQFREHTIHKLISLAQKEISRIVHQRNRVVFQRSV